MRKSRSNLVVIAMQDEISGHGVEHLLSRSRKLTVLRTRLNDEHSLLQRTKSAQPTVLITDETDMPSWRPEISALFENYPDLCVVFVNRKANCAHMLSRNKSCYRSAAEFLKLIETSIGY